MKSFFLFVFLGLLSYASFSQATGKSKIVLKDKTVINGVKIWNIYSNKIEYEEKESLHDLLTERIARIETDTAVLSFDEAGQLNSRPYDWIIKVNDDTVQCIISQLGGNYIYYYPKGRENRSYIPETSVKKYQVFKPRPVQMLVQGSAPYSPQMPARDTANETGTGNVQETTAVPIDSATPSVETIEPEKQEADSAIKKMENNKTEENREKETPATLPAHSDFCYDSYIKGERDANRKSESAWGTGSFCLTGCFGGIPVSALSLIALNSKKKPKKIPDGVDEKCYLLGYQNQQTKRRVYNTAVGGLISSVVVIGVTYMFLVISSNQM